jgi:hypothetical protein
VIAYQAILGTNRATGFVDSVNTLIEHLEIRQQQLASELQETTTTLEVFKRLSGSGDESGHSLPLSSIAHLEQQIPQLEPVVDAETINGHSTARGMATESNSESRGATSTFSRGDSHELDNEQKRSPFSPRTSVVREFQGKTLRQAIKMILQRKLDQPFSIDEILYTLYGRNMSKESFKIAKPIVITELSKGKAGNHWSSVEGRRGFYMLTSEAASGDEVA